MLESRGAAYIIQKAEERHIGLIELWTFDLRGQLQVRTILRPELDGVLELGLAIESRHLASASDERWTLVPDPLTFAALPRVGHDELVARLLCDLETADGAPVSRCARTTLKRQLGRAKTLGYSAYVSATLDVRFVTPAPPGYRPVSADRARALARRAALHAESLGIPLAAIGSDGAAELWRFELSAVDPLSLADALVSLRRILGDTATAAEVHATFMPRPWADAERASLALTLALVEGADAGRADAGRERAAATPDRAFAARMARDLGALELVARPSINGRLTAGALAVRATAAAESGPAIQFAGADANANPYLYLSLALGAALDATAEVERALAPEDDASAIVRARRSPLVREVLGPELLADLATQADAEESAWRAQITALDFERDRRG